MTINLVPLLLVIGVGAVWGLKAAGIALLSIVAINIILSALEK